MRTRALHLGATIQVEAAPPPATGTWLTLSIPLPIPIPLPPVSLPEQSLSALPTLA